jgi:hypothetical protein
LRWGADRKLKLFTGNSTGPRYAIGFLWSVFWLALGSIAAAQEDKKTDDLKPSDPGRSTVEERALGLLPNPLEKNGVKFAVAYVGEGLGNPSGGLKPGSVYEDRINFATDIDFEKLVGSKQLTFHANVFQIDGGGLSRGSLKNFLLVSRIEAQPTKLASMRFGLNKMGDLACPARARPGRQGRPRPFAVILETIRGDGQGRDRPPGFDQPRTHHRAGRRWTRG